MRSTRQLMLVGIGQVGTVDKPVPSRATHVRCVSSLWTDARLFDVMVMLLVLVVGTLVVGEIHCSQDRSMVVLLFSSFCVEKLASEEVKEVGERCRCSWHVSVPILFYLPWVWSLWYWTTVWVMFVDGFIFLDVSRVLGTNCPL